MTTPFDIFWSAYPSAPKRPKVGKQYCRNLWERRKLDTQFEQIMRALAYHKEHLWNMEEPQYIPMCRTWLFQYRYDMEIPEERKALTEAEILRIASR